MRPVNLIPLDQRRGQNAQMRTGPVPYILVGALVAVLAGVAALVVTGNQIAEGKAEIVQLKREDAAAQEQAESLAAYTRFQQLHEATVATVTSLADSRFDWERVMRELSLVLPHDVWLVTLDASASSEAGGAASSGSEGGGLGGSIPGPSLTISGCAAGHEAVAGFVTALKDIDGVTRVGVESSELAEQDSGSGSAGGGSSDDCRTRDFIAQFDLVVAFDAAPVAVEATTTTATTAAPPSAAEDAEGASSEASESSEGG